MFRGKVDADVAVAAVPEEAPAGPDTLELGVMVDVEGLGIIADGAPMIAPSVPVGVAPATPVDPVVTVGTVAPVDPARVVVAEVAGERLPAPIPMAVAPVGDAGESVDDTVDDVGDAAEDVGDIVEDVGETVVVAGIVAAVIAGLLADVAVGVAAAALFPIPDVLIPGALVVSSSRQEASASAKISRTPVLKTVSTTNLFCRSKTAGEVVFHRLALPLAQLEPGKRSLLETGS